jgi:hypothetical protein
MASVVHSLPAETSPGSRAGLVLYDLAASGGVAHGLVEHRASLLCEMLAGDPNSVFHTIPLPADGTDRLLVSFVIRDDLSINPALAANDASH